MTNAVQEKPTTEKTEPVQFEEYRLRSGRLEVLCSDQTISEVYDLTEWSLGCPEATRPLGRALIFGTPAAVLLGMAYTVGTWWSWAVLGLLALPLVLLTLIHMVVHTHLVLESESGETARLLVGDFGFEFLMFGAEIAAATQQARGLPDNDEEA